VNGLSADPRPQHQPPRRVRLGADAWLLLAEAVSAAGAALTPPFRIADGPVLDDAQRAAATAALRGSALVTGDGGDLLADLHPSVRESLLAHVQPQALIDSRVGLGDALRAARHAVRGELASAVAREQRPAGERLLELGEVELSTMLVDDLVADVLRGFGDLGGAAGREPLALDAAMSLAVVDALADGRADLARALLERPALPAPLEQLADGLQAVAQVAVAGPTGAQVLVAMRLADGWWTAAIAEQDVQLIPVAEDDLVTEIAAALTTALWSAAAT
jgi:hypothetical protein